MPMEKLLNKYTQLYGQPACRNMPVSNKNCQIYFCHETSLCQPYNEPCKRQDVYKTVRNNGTRSKQQHERQNIQQ